MEKWREVYTEEQIKHIQRIELQSLKVINDVCNKLGITFIVYGGTLLGTIKYHGFIPWDDDLDIAMVREDYMKFIREAPKLLPKEYVLQTPYTDKKTPYLYSKLRLKGTRCIEYCHSKLPIEQEIYIDIYPIDNIADDDTIHIRQHRKFQKLAKLYSLRQCKYTFNPPKTIGSKLKALIKIGIAYILRIIPQKYFIKKMDQILTQYNSIETVRKGNLFYPSPKNVFYDFYPLQDGHFEGIKVKLPGNWDKHLRMRYGDYTQLPPLDQRIGHKPYVLDFGVK